MSATFENYAHLGYDRRAPAHYVRLGSGGACCSAARMTGNMETLYSDAARGHGFGLDLCTVKNLNIRGGLDIVRRRRRLEKEIFPH